MKKVPNTGPRYLSGLYIYIHAFIVRSCDDRMIKCEVAELRNVEKVALSFGSGQYLSHQSLQLKFAQIIPAKLSGASVSHPLTLTYFP